MPTGEGKDQKGPTRVAVEDLWKGRKTGSLREVPPLSRLGYQIFKWLIGLICAFVIVLCLFAVFTYPRLEDIRGLVPSGTDALGPWREMRAEWMTQFKDLGQLYLVTPILPLLGAVMGYIFGRHQSETDSPGPPQGA